MLFETEIHLEYDNQPAGASPASLTEQLNQRREKLQRSLASLSGEADWQARSFPVLAVLAPVMSTHEEKIEFPGDPMALYAALSYSVAQAVTARRAGLGPDSPYNDLCPRWGEFPSPAYRQSVSASGIRQYDSPTLNTDQTVFDPRVWNAQVKRYFVEVVLAQVKPRVVLIGAVSPAHRYAIDIARTVRAHLPDCLVILGGRHADETIHYEPLARRLVCEPTSPVSKMMAAEIEPVFDLILSGQGYYALDLLLKAIALAMDVETQAVTVAGVAAALTGFAPHLNHLRGQAVLTAISAGKIHVWPLNGSKLILSELPSPYQAFAIRARFPVFARQGQVLRTAHFMVTNSCPFHCYFCSEGSAVVGEFLTFHADEVEVAVARMVEYIDYGAEAIFFDDSIFWAGNAGHIITFARLWSCVRQQAQLANTPVIELYGRRVERQKILDLEWGAQLTVDAIVSRRQPAEGRLMLEAMRAAGCTYLYIGIESMAEDVIVKVHKNISSSLPWDQRVRLALGIAHQVGLRVGASVLFGLEGETAATMAETIEKVEELLAEDLLMIASPNILTYHPNTAISHQHEMENKLDYHSVNLDNRPPYSYFEEAFPAVVSRNLNETDIWQIHRQTGERWGVRRNSTPMPPTVLAPD